MIFTSLISVFLSISLLVSAEIASEVAREDLDFAYAQVVLNDLYHHSSFYSSYFTTTDLFTNYLSLTEAVSTEPFWNRWAQTTEVQLLLSIYSALPTSKQSILYQKITSVYEQVTSEDATETSWESPPITTPSSSRWNTRIPHLTTPGIYSDVFVYAQCDALANDIQDYGSIYNSFFKTYTDTQLLTSFREQMTTYLNATVVSKFDKACTNMVDLISVLPWSDRVAAEAKQLFRTYSTSFIDIETSTNSKYTTTTFTDTSVDLTNVAQSLLYEQAKYYAVLKDYQSNVDQYTSLLTSYLDDDNQTSIVQQFANDLSMLNASGTNIGTSAQSDIYRDIANVYSLFTWSDRLAYVAKQAYESYNSKPISEDSSTVTATEASTTVNTITTIRSSSTSSAPSAPSATPVLTSKIVTATATGSVEITNVFPIIVVNTTTTGQDKAESISQTTLTLVQTVAPNSTYTSGTHNTITVTQDIISAMYCGVDALLMDYQNITSQSAYNSYISNNLHKKAVSTYVSILSKFTTVNVIHPSSTSEYTEVLVGLYNFIFDLPSQFRPRLFDIMGYAYMNHVTATTGMTLSKHQSGEGDLFNSLFVFGGKNSEGQAVVMVTVKKTLADGKVTSVESLVTDQLAEGDDNGGQNVLIFPTALTLDLVATTSQDPEFFYITKAASDATHSLATTLHTNRLIQD
ncbi:unnamed protein product [Ambrosiozyma monospora]|uniref:Unnamed protein product n=1 Tax=Ambrosiozyma monospora TaxID=43982 RepID=A0ACB5T4M5_AMBMO|nr:unnamed protein product [Ambrosiozyma monospora]